MLILPFRFMSNLFDLHLYFDLLFTTWRILDLKIAGMLEFKYNYSFALSQETCTAVSE